MKITRRYLRQIISEEIVRLKEVTKQTQEIIHTSIDMNKWKPGMKLLALHQEDIATRLKALEEDTDRRLKALESN